MNIGRKLPPLNAVRSFEAAARHKSFALAADELFVTPSAISQQIKQLEDWFGFSLFERLPRGLALTDYGREYLPGLTRALDLVADETRILLDRKNSQNLTVSLLSSLAALWLVPRLHRFTDKHPDICVRVASSARIMDFRREGVDLSIRFGQGGYQDGYVEKLMDETIMPVCSPHYLKDAPTLKQVDDLHNHRLMHDDGVKFPNSKLYWQDWLGHFGQEVPDNSSSPEFSDSHLTTMAVLAGQGVMLGRSVLVADTLASGALVAPLKEKLPSGVSYYFVCPEDRMQEPKIAAFLAWIREETSVFR